MQGGGGGASPQKSNSPSNRKPASISHLDSRRNTFNLINGSLSTLQTAPLTTKRPSIAARQHFTIGPVPDYSTPASGKLSMRRKTVE